MLVMISNLDGFEGLELSTEDKIINITSHNLILQTVLHLISYLGTKAALCYCLKPPLKEI